MEKRHGDVESALHSSRTGGKEQLPSCFPRLGGPVLARQETSSTHSGPQELSHGKLYKPVIVNQGVIER